ncbi:hypothetical protein HN51_007531 [Arachis hypogaea]|uniref:probable protein phosphatase 2C 33 n=1 Tax=Arachis hypogaea TaxID=3818 RepID=UPI003B22054A|nr:putative protein phosphatase 2C [Arachis hypogaea]
MLMSKHKPSFKIWDVLSNEEVVDIVASSPRPSAARSLVESAVKVWRMKFPLCKVDDCAAVCLFVDSNLDSGLASTADDSTLEPPIDQSEQSFLLSEKGTRMDAEEQQQ